MLTPRLNIVSQQGLEQSVMALTSFWLADRPTRFASPWPTEKTAAMLRESGIYDKLVGFGLWTFGDLGQSPSN